MMLALCLAALLPIQEPGPVPEPLREELDLSLRYRQLVDVHGLPVVASARVRPEALAEAGYLIDAMLGHAPELLQAMADAKVRFTVMAHDELTTDVPEHANLFPPRYWDRRARGLGATPVRPSVSCGEENLLEFPGDPYSTENILVHEFAHAVHKMGLHHTDPTFDGRLKAAYEAALAEGLWEGTYAASTTPSTGRRRCSPGSTPTAATITTTARWIPERSSSSTTRACAR